MNYKNILTYKFAFFSIIIIIFFVSIIIIKNYINPSYDEIDMSLNVISSIITVLYVILLYYQIKQSNLSLKTQNDQLIKANEAIILQNTQMMVSNQPCIIISAKTLTKYYEYHMDQDEGQLHLKVSIKNITNYPAVFIIICCKIELNYLKDSNGYEIEYKNFPKEKFIANFSSVRLDYLNEKEEKEINMLYRQIGDIDIDSLIKEFEIQYADEYDTIISADGKIELVVLYKNIIGQWFESNTFMDVKEYCEDSFNIQKITDANSPHIVDVNYVNKKIQSFNKYERKIVE